MDKNREKPALAKKLLPIALAITLTVSGTGTQAYAQNEASSNSTHSKIKGNVVVADILTPAQETNQNPKSYVLHNVEFGAKRVYIDNDEGYYNEYNVKSEIKKITITGESYTINDEATVYKNSDGCYSFTTLGLSKEAQIIINSPTDPANTLSHYHIILHDFHAKATENNQKIFDNKSFKTIYFFCMGNNNSISAKDTNSTAEFYSHGFMRVHNEGTLFLNNTVMNLGDGFETYKAANPKIYSNKSIVARRFYINSGVIAVEYLGLDNYTNDINITGSAVVYCKADKTLEKKYEKGILFTGADVTTTIKEEAGKVTDCKVNIAGGVKQVFGNPDIRIGEVTVELKDKLTYNGAEQEQKVDVYTNVDKTIKLDENDYTITGNKQTDAGNYTLTVKGKGKYSFEKTFDWNIEKKEISIKSATIKSKAYDGSKKAEVDDVKFNNTVKPLEKDKDFAVSAEFKNEKAGNGKEVDVTVTLKDNAAKNYKFNEGNSAVYVADGNITAKKLEVKKENIEIKYDVDSSDKTKFEATINIKGASLANGKYMYQVKEGAENSTNPDNQADKWLATNVFKGLRPEEEHTFFVKAVPTDTTNYVASETVKKSKVLELLENKEVPNLNPVVTEENGKKFITIEEVSGAEYKFGNGNYGDSNKSEGQEAGTKELKVGIRYKKTHTHKASAENTFTEKLDQVTDLELPVPDLVIADETDKGYAGKYIEDGNTGEFKIQFTARHSKPRPEGRRFEYRRSDKDEWQDSEVFKGIEPGLTLSFSGRMKAAPGKSAGKIGKSITVTFDKLDQVKPSLAGKYTVTSVDNGTNKKIVINEIAGTEYKINDEEWKSDWNSGKVEIIKKAEGTVKISLRFKETVTRKSSEADVDTINLTNTNSNSGSGSYGGGGVVTPSSPTETTKPADNNTEKQEESKQKEENKENPVNTEEAKNETEKVTADIVSKGKAAAEISADTVRKAVAKTEAGENVKIEVIVPKKTKSIEFNLVKEALSSVLNSEAKGIEIKTTVAKVELDRKALKAVDKKAEGDITLTVKPIKKLSENEKKVVGKRPVYKILIKSGDTNISSFDGGKVKMEVPYKKAKNENPKGLYAAYINKAGKIVRIKGSKYDSKTGMITFNIKKTVKFVIIYKASKTKKNK